MKIWVTGSEGMLGRAVARAVAARGYELMETSRLECLISDRPSVIRSISDADVVINCAGVTPTSARATVPSMINANALGPHILADVAQDRRVILVSTDCVFSGEDGIQNRPYTIESRPDPKDIYGRSKLLGEVMMPHVLIVRTSFVGKESGLLRWLLDQPKGATIDGWASAMWNGTSVRMAADALVIEAGTGSRQGIHHMASSERVSKFWLLRQLIKIFNLDIRVNPLDEPVIDRTLHPTMELPDISWALERLP